MTNALTKGDQKINDIYTQNSEVYKVFLDTKFTQTLIKQIADKGFSRIPVAFSEEKPIIVGILLTKSCIAIEVNDLTIAELYTKGLLQL